MDSHSERLMDESHIEYSVDTIAVVLDRYEFAAYHFAFVVALTIKLITIDGKLKWSVR